MDGIAALTESAGAGRAPSLRTRLLALVALLAGTLLLLAALAVWQAHDAARRRASEQLLAAARAMALVVDQEFAPGAGPPGGPGGISSRRRGRPGGLPRGRPAPPAGSPGTVMSLIEPPARQVANTVQGTGAAGRPTLPGLGAVFETGAPVVTRLLPGTITGAPVIATAIPMPGRTGVRHGTPSA
jgi:hypothetical protein